MTIPAQHCEAILRGYAKKRDKGGDWISVLFQLHPQDIPAMLNDAPLGTRFMLALVEIGDDEQPVVTSREGAGPNGPKYGKTGTNPSEKAGPLPDTPPELAPGVTRPKTPGERAIRHAATLCGKSEFQTFMFDLYPNAIWAGNLTPAANCKMAVRQYCGVESCAEFKTSAVALGEWLVLVERYRQSQEPPAVGEKR